MAAEHLRPREREEGEREVGGGDTEGEREREGETDSGYASPVLEREGRLAHLCSHARSGEGLTQEQEWGRGGGSPEPLPPSHQTESRIIK